MNPEQEQPTSNQPSSNPAPTTYENQNPPVQSQNISDAAFSQQPQPQPAYQPPVQPVPVQPVPLQPAPPSAQPVQPMFAQQPSQPVQKPSRLVLWIGLAVAIVLLLSLVGGYFGLKITNDAKAQTYKKNAAAYLSELKSKLTTSSTMSSAQSIVDSMATPKLEGTLLGGLSSSYSNAQTVQAQVNSDVNNVKQNLKEMAAVEKLHSDFKQLEGQMKTAVSDTFNSSTRTQLTYNLGKVITVVENEKSTIEKASLSASLSSAKDNTVKGLSDQLTALKRMSVAVSNNDSRAYSAASADLSTAESSTSTALEPIKTYYNNLDTKKSDMLKSIDNTRKKVDPSASPTAA